VALLGLDPICNTWLPLLPPVAAAVTVHCSLVLLLLLGALLHPLPQPALPGRTTPDCAIQLLGLLLPPAAAAAADLTPAAAVLGCALLAAVLLGCQSLLLIL
jgi:hypothetical protein